MKRLLSVFLILVMMLSLVPLGVYAEDGEGTPLPEEEIVDTVEADETEGDIGHKPVNGICSSCGAVEVSEINFPDEIFRAYIIRNISGASDAWLTKDELMAVTDITIGNSNVSSLKGIEHFTALEILYCKENANLTSLDLSKNTELYMLNCGSTPLTTLDLSKNTKLRTLDCHKTQLTSLDLSNNTELYELGCGATLLTTLDLSKNTKLGSLHCSNGQLTSIDLSGCEQLQTIVCDSNLLTNLDLSGKSRLRVVNCHSNSLVSLNLSGCSSVENVFCGSNQLTSLVLDGCTKLTVIDCKDNQLTELDIKDCKKLSSLDCSGNYLGKLDVSNNTELYNLNCEDNYLTGLNLTKSRALRLLYCSVNELTSLDLSKNTELHQLYCAYNYLTSLDLSNCLKLNYLDHQYNICAVTAEQNEFDLSTLPNFDVSRVVEVVGGTLEGNILTAESEAVGYYYDCGLGVALGFVLLIENFCEHDWSETSCTANKTCTLCGTVRSAALDHEWNTVICTEAKTCTVCGETKNAEASHEWADADCTVPKTCSVCGETDGDIGHKPVNGICVSCGAVEFSETNFPDEKFRAYLIETISGTSDAWLTKDELKAVTSIYADSRGISSLKGIEFFTSLEYLKCDNNSLTELDVSKNTKLEFLECSENSLTELDLSKNTELEYLGCSTNALTALDLSNNSKIGMLSCSANNLRELDLSGCPELWAIYCASNQLTSLDLSGCPAVRDLECGDNNLTSLDVSGCRNLWLLDCSLNQLTSLNVSGCKSLDDLDCSNNALTSLSLSDNTLLSKLNCSNNKLERLDLSKNIILHKVDCSYNYLTSLDLSEILDLHYLIQQNNIRAITVEQNKFDLSTLPGFDVSKASGWIGGSVEGNILTAESEAVGYYYDVGFREPVGFVLAISNFCEHDWSEASCTEAQTCSLCGATEGEALGHDFGEWEEVDEENIRRECARCGHEEIRPANLSVRLSAEELGGSTVVWIDGVEYGVEYDGDVATVYLPENASVMTAYTFHSGDGSDVHTQYPTFMKVWMLKYDGSAYSAEYIKEFDNLLQYSGSSIRIVGNKGIRMISSVNKTVKQALTGGGLAGYKLVEYGTVLAQTSKMEGGPLILGQSYSRSNYAYKKGVADPVFKDTGKLVQYTNVLVGFNNDQCKEDIAMRPYMIVEDADGNKVTIYGGTIYRSIGYIAWQNRNAFQPKTAAYNYVWEIIHHVYGSKYDSEFKG